MIYAGVAQCERVAGINRHGASGISQAESEPIGVRAEDDRIDPVTVESQSAMSLTPVRLLQATSRQG
jgi:hypothetical protein